MWTWLLCTAPAAALDAPEPVDPIEGAVVETLTPTLTVADPAEPTATLILEVYEGDDGTEIIATRRGLRQGSDSSIDGLTSWTVDVSLTEDAVYSWVAYSQTNTETSEASTRATLRVNASNRSPAAPVAVSPAHGVTVGTDPPTLTVTRGSDPDGDTVLTHFRVEDGLGEVLEQGSTADTGIEVSFTGTTGLGDAERCWRAWSVDQLGATSAVSELRCLWADADNAAPTAPVFESPAPDSVHLEVPTLQLEPCTDPEERALTLHWEVLNSSDDLLESSSWRLGEHGPWSLSPTLPEGELTATAWCDDGDAESTVATVTFTLDADAEGPPAPTGLTPDGEPWLVGEALAWNTDEEDLTYTVTVEDAGGAVIWSEQTSDTSVAPDASGGFTVGEYTWSVLSTDAGGLESPTASASFTIEGPDDTGADTGYGRDGRPCGCQGSPASPWWMALLGLAWRRRSVDGEHR